MSAAVSPVSAPAPAPKAAAPSSAPKGQQNGFAQMLNDAVQPQAGDVAADAAAQQAAQGTKNHRPAQAKSPNADAAKNTKATKSTEGEAKIEKTDGKELRGEKDERLKPADTDTDATATVLPTPPAEQPVDLTAAQALIPKDGESLTTEADEGADAGKGKGQRALRLGAGEGDAASRGRAVEKPEARAPEAAARTETSAASNAAWQAAAERVALPVNGEAAKADVAALNAAVGANTALSAPVAAKPAEAAAQTPVYVPAHVASAEFPQSLGVQVSLLARDGIQQAELHLNPAEMGPVSIKIAIDGTQAQVNFGADSAVTRNAIENGLPELATALREAGFTLSGGGVHQQASGRREGGGDSNDGSGVSRGHGREPDVADVPRVTSATLHGRTAAGGIDVYA